MSCGDAPAALPPAAVEGVLVSFTGPDDDEVEGGALRQLSQVRFEGVAPVRRFGSFKGQRNFTGSWWFATTGRHVGFESWVERDQVMLLDFDSSVIGVASQPFWLTLRLGGGPRRHVPDYFVRLADGSAVVVDVRPDERISPDDAMLFAATAAACAEVGWGYRRVGVVDPVLAANLRWLAGYRHPRCLSPLVADRVRAGLIVPGTVEEVVAAAGDRLAVLPTLFHLMWTGEVTTDLAAAPLTLRTRLMATRRAA